MTNNNLNTSDVFGGHSEHPSEETTFMSETSLNSDTENSNTDRLDSHLSEESQYGICRQIDLWKEELDSGVSMVSIFPDSNTAILYEHSVKVFYLASIDKELLAPTAMLEYEVHLVATTGILISFKDIYGKHKYIFTNGVTEKNMYGPTYEVANPNKPYLLTLTGIDGKVEVSVKSTENVSASTLDNLFAYDKDVKVNPEVYSYPSGKFIVIKDEAVHYSDLSDKLVFTLAKYGVGCFFGYSLFVNHENLTNLESKSQRDLRYKIISRLCITSLLLQELDTGSFFVIGVRTNQLVALEDITSFTVDQLKVVNGVPLFLKDTETHREISVFSPNLQHIPIRVGKVNPLNEELFGNGVFITKEGVLLLDNGSVAIASKVKSSKSKYLIRGKKYSTPIAHVGKLNELSNTSTKKEIQK